MKLGVDFGTTRIVAAAADRGNYPILKFETREGAVDWFPSLVALRGAERRYGWDAWTVQGEPGWTVVRSLKRMLEEAGADTWVEVDGARYPLMDLLTGMITEFRRALGLEDPFEVIFPRGTPLPAPGEPPLSVHRCYQPVHNVGHLRYLEASHVDGSGRPAGDIAVWDEVLFPLDPAMEKHEHLESAPVEPSEAAAGQQIEERYACNAAGTLAVTIHNLTSQHVREYTLGRWSAKAGAVTAPARRRGRR